MVDFSTYQPPGVYVEETLSSVINLVGVRPGVLAIVGPSRGYRLGEETVTLAEEDGVGIAVELAEEGIDSDNIVVTHGGVTLTPNEHYTISQTGSGANAVTTITGLFYGLDDSLGQIPDNAFEDGEEYVVSVSYRYTDEDYYEPQRFTDFDEVQDQYGPALNIENGTVNSPLSFAARFAFQNGASQIVLVSTDDSLGVPVDPNNLEGAYAKLQGDGFRDVSLIVPLLVDIESPSSAIQDLASHVASAATQGLFRVGVVGVETSVDDSPTTLASAAASSRVMLAWPNRVNYFHGYNNQTIEIGGYYLAAAYAGRLISLQSQVPLTRKRIYGFSGFPSAVNQTMSKSNKDNWSSHGVAVTEIDRQGQMVVRHGVTTSTLNIHEREVSLVRSRDTLINLLQETVDGSGLIGS